MATPTTIEALNSSCAPRESFCGQRSCPTHHQAFRVPHTEIGGRRTPRISSVDSPQACRKTCKIRESQTADTWIYTFENPVESEPRARAAHKLYYFAGGGFRGVPEKEHWLLCAELGMKLLEYEINLVSYLLTPNSPASHSLAHLERFYDVLTQQPKEENFRITLFGDSSGGNIALVLGLYAAFEYLKDHSGPCPVEAIMAMCPATDLRNENPDIDVVDPRDPILSRKTTTEVAHGWAGEMSLSDPRVSPILADLSLYRKAGIKVDGVTAGNDVCTHSRCNPLSKETRGMWCLGRLARLGETDALLSSAVCLPCA